MIYPNIEPDSDLVFQEIKSEDEDRESTPEEFEIATYPADYTLEILYQLYKNGEIIIPPFQRQYVWTMNQASRLIESFLLGLPVPQIFLYSEKDTGRFLVVDGQQRIKSIFYYFQGFFGEEDQADNLRVFRMQGINENSRWYKKSFKELEPVDQRRLRNAVLRAIIVKQLNPEDDTSIYHIYERLNSGGTSLNTQEIRNCVYSGKLSSLLYELNLYENWRKIIGNSKPDRRQRDIELILRYIALFHWRDRYKKPMKDFLSSFMKRHRNPDIEFLEQEKLRFKSTCDVVVTRLGEKPFNPYRGLNTAIFDAVFVAFACHHLSEIPGDIADRYKRLLKDDCFKECTESGTTDPTSVRKRYERAEKILFGEIPEK